MIRRIVTVLAGALCCFFSLVALAASFDCAKAGSAAEKLVCSDSELSKADEELSTVYNHALDSSAEKSEFKKEQLNWIRTRRNPCRDKKCLAAAYKERIEVLSGPVPMGEYYLRDRFSTAATPADDKEEADDEKSDGPCYHVCVKVHGTPSAPLIDFEIYFPDSGQSVTAESVRCKAATDGTLTFSFTDNWGNLGKGKFDRYGEEATLNVEDVKSTDEPGWNRNALRNYGEYQLTKQKCGPADDD